MSCSCFIYIVAGEDCLINMLRYMCTCIYCVSTSILFLLCIFILFMLLFNFVIYVFL